jgi:acyl transferase domain-containing protein
MSQTAKSTTKQTAGQRDSRLNKRLKDMPIAIVGMASIFANSRYLNKFWDLISEKIDAITEVPDTHWDAQDYYDLDKTKADKSYCKRGGFMPEVNFNPMEFGLPPNILELTDTSQLLSLIVAKEVLADANLPADYDRDKIGITLGVGGGQKISQSLNARLQYPVLKKVFSSSGISDHDSEMLIKKFQDQYIHWEENSFPGSLGNVIAGRIANRFDLGGMNCVVDAACAGSLAAMRLALSELVEGRAEMMITGGVCTDNSPSMYMSFSKTPAFTTNETIQPFDIDSKGMMIGEGIGMIALKRLEDAERDGDRIYSVIKGIGSSSDGKFKSIYAPRPEGQAKALKRAYDDAGFAPHTLGLIEAHGTGTAAGDLAEFNGLKSVFSEACDTKQHIALGSVKSQIGHTKSTAGTAGLIKAALALHHKVLPATINVSQPNPKLDIENSPFYLNTETRPWLPRPDGTPRRAGISSFGFGGTNFHFVLEEYHSEHRRDNGKLTQYRQRSLAQSFLFSGANKAELLASLNNTLGAVDDGHSLNEIASDHGVRALEISAPRLGLMASSNDELIKLLNQAMMKLQASNEPHWSLPGGIHYREEAMTKAKVAALFAGQGSQYLNMGRELACHFPEVREQFVRADKIFDANHKTPLSQLVYPMPVFNIDAQKAQEAELTNTANAQSAIGAISMGQYALFTAAGFTADMVAGHSFGELSALCAAEVISLDDYYKLTFARGNAMATQLDNGVDSGTMYAIITKTADDLEQVETSIAAFDGVKVANYNSPTQLVIAGPTAATGDAANALGKLGFKAISLPVSAAFHTPLVGHAQAPFALAIDSVKFSKPKCPIYANATGELYDNTPKTIKREFKQHMLQSVRFSTQLQAMYDAGARVFVEFGPKNVLQKLVENTLNDKMSELCIVSINPNAKGDSDLQLRQAAMQLAVYGIALVDLDPYAAPIATEEKPSAMNIKLTATNHISPATKAKMAKSLQNGTISSQIIVEEKVVEVEKLVEVEKMVEVEKIVEKIVQVNTAATATQPSPTPLAQTSSAAITPPASGDALAQFFAAQHQAAQLHQQFLTIPQQYSETFTTLMTAQAQMAASGITIPESLQRSMEQFHQHQAQTLQSHTQFLELQAQSNNTALSLFSGGNIAPMQTTPMASANTPATQTPTVSTAPLATVTPTPTILAPTPAEIQTVEPRVQSTASAAPIATAIAVTEPLTSPASSALSADKVQTTMMNVVAEKTGYPTAMLELEMDMEADLGIDSIKRVEILGTVQDELPDLPELSPEDLAECRTLGEIVIYMASQLPAEDAVSVKDAISTENAISRQQSVASGLTHEQVQHTMMNVVAEKTGYPTEMLALEMDMEADLGIDSIKRVEILGTVQDELPDLPELSPEDLAECRTLGEIVIYMASQLPAEDAVSVKDAISTENAISNQQPEAIAPVSNEPSVELPPHSEVALKKLDAAELVNNCFAANTKLVITDDGHNAGVLAEKLVKQGLQVAIVRLPNGQPQSPLNSDIASFQVESKGEAGILAVIEQIEQQLGDIGGFIHLQPQETANAKGSGVNLSDDSFNHLSQAFLWAKLLQPKLTVETMARRCFVTVSRIDGGFGYLDPEQLKTAELNQAALAGLTKTLSHEWPGVFCRALDIAPNLAASQLSDGIASELFDAHVSLNEVGLSQNAQGEIQRMTLIAGDASVKTATSDLTNTDKILVTGGAKGVTFECALALAKRCQSHFILAGRSQHLPLNNLPTWAQGKPVSELKSAAIAHIMASGEKPSPKQVDALVWPVQSSLEIHAALAAFYAVGASAEYISMDVSDADSVNRTLGAITQITPITGLIHGAGVLADKHIQDKTLDELARVYGTKVNGLKALLNVIDASQLKLVAMFSSAAGFYGNTGQSDYAMSNDILNKAALQLSALNPNAKVMSFNWGPWDGGMVNPALKKMFTDRGVYVIPLQAGAELFATQLLKESGVQLLVGTDMQGNGRSDIASKEAVVKKPNAGEVQLAQRPQRNATVLLKRVLDPATLVFIQDHRIGGNPVLPTVCAIQWMREAALEHYGLTFMVQDYKLLKGVIFDSRAVQTLTMELTPQYEAGELKNIKALICHEGRPQYQAQLFTVNDTDFALKSFDSLSHAKAITDRTRLYSDGTLFHGPRLQGLNKVLCFGEQGLIASCELPAINPGDCGDFVPSLQMGGCQPFAEDLLLQAMLVWARLTYGAASLPSTIDEFISVQPMQAGDKGFIELEVIKTSGRSLEANVRLYHENGALSAIMKSAKVTISKRLNTAFVADQQIKEDHA